MSTLIAMADVRRPANDADIGVGINPLAVIRGWFRTLAVHEDLAVAVLIYVYGISVVW